MGPFQDRAAAEDRLRQLKSEGLIPRDSFIASGGDYRAPFWPAGQSAPVVALSDPGDTLSSPPNPPRCPARKPRRRPVRPKRPCPRSTPEAAGRATMVRPLRWQNRRVFWRGHPAQHGRLADRAGRRADGYPDQHPKTKPCRGL
ncbi:hypothetical protein ACFSHQ_16985 [Gemmobacter lanyuensis]